MDGITILGATGSIGLSTLSVISRNTDRFRVVALTANSDVDRMAKLCAEYRPRYAAMADKSAALALAERLRADCPDIEVAGGVEAVVDAARRTDASTVMAAIVGAAGLRPTLAAVDGGKRVLLANKEALVMSGRLFMDAVQRNGAKLLPVDSEHNAIFQCLPGQFDGELNKLGVNRILLTASGGPFRTVPAREMRHVTPEQACAHPNWSMGRKISVDSATMMNKGLEVIEACWLFNVPPERIQVVLHPQSVIHSMVEYVDGSVLAQLGSPDMRTPIAHALAFPDRIPSGAPTLDLFAVRRLDFEPPDFERFPCLQLAYDAIRRGGTATTWLNAANEIAVAAFLAGQIKFTQISQTIDATLQAADISTDVGLENILAADQAARHWAAQYVERVM